jgi:hypothetical protein
MRQKNTIVAINAIPATPPTTPPTIGATWLDAGAGVGVGEWLEVVEVVGVGVGVDDVFGVVWDVVVGKIRDRLG